ncbi:hypothetical protein V493_04168 [Pseudogymnoascus sp. VKM F-4281 (FW-2241)]|nr:hypothetical protein V493_04168 [Pseudogymnoascus sp. VKM F-4281 (FW-2241)]
MASSSVRRVAYHKAKVTEGLGTDNVTAYRFDHVLIKAYRKGMDLVVVEADEAVDVNVRCRTLQVTDNEEDNNNTQLFRAAKQGREDLVRKLLQEGVRPDGGHYEKRGHTALTIACDEDHEGIVLLLLEHGADVDAKNQENARTPLFWAAGAGNANVVKLLLEAGADPNGAEDNGRLTPLAVAAVRGHEDAVWALLEKGYDIDVDRKGTLDGRTVLSHSAEDGQWLIVTGLMDRGADPDSRDRNGRTPLSWAAETGRAMIVEILLTRGADPNSMDEKHCIFVGSPGGRTPLFYAADKGHEDVVGLLLQKGANANHCDQDKWSALGRAVVRGHVNVVKVLLEHGGADPEIGQIFGDSLLEYAERQLGAGGEHHRPSYVNINQLLQKWSKKGERPQASGFLEQFYAMWR